jgi:hypothetical protein
VQEVHGLGEARGAAFIWEAFAVVGDRIPGRLASGRFLAPVHGETLTAAVGDRFILRIQDNAFAEAVIVNEPQAFSVGE